ncbi:MAG: ATP-binding cassette domain-containing protein [Candidatus Ranarchaeia archaeon]
MVSSAKGEKHKTKIPTEAFKYKLVIRDLLKIYESKAEEVFALRSIDFEAEKGEIIAIVGPSGSGKTTLLRMIGALDYPSAGKIYVSGRDITQFDGQEILEYRRKKVGFVWQKGNLVNGLTVLENVMLPLKIVGVSKNDAANRAKELLQEVGLEHRLDFLPTEISGGENQRVAIAIALANEPDLILGDELTGELDTETGDKVMDYLKKINKKFRPTIIYVTHSERAANYADRVLHLTDGMIVGQDHFQLGAISEIDQKGRLVIPQELRMLIGLKKRVRLIEGKGELIIQPIEKLKEDIQKEERSMKNE